MATKKELNEALKFMSLILGEDAANKLTYVETAHNFPYFFHISKDFAIKKFIPCVTERSMQGEDRSIPRICTSDSLWGCMVGYSAIDKDFESDIDMQDKFWQGGYKIYGIPCKVAIAPRKQEVPDVDKTDEHWIVPFNEDHREIAPIDLGRFFCKERHTVREKDQILFSYVFYLEAKCPMQISRSHSVEKGYWRIGSTRNKSHVWFNPILTIEPVTKEEYLSVKNATVSLLSFDDKPSSAKWK